ncbi:retropepsin-like aspartic protease [Rheinheimera sp.]|uniref:retropepsin-like aspartic protease n=1 Tax=Rheinheimera sp. TaxID=1869214 RepID=UPI002FDCA9E5
MFFKTLCMVLAALAFNAKANVTEWIDFKFNGGAIQVPVKIAGVDATATIDSKAKTNYLSDDFAAKHQDKFKKTGVILFKDQFGERNVSVFQDVKVHIFGADLPFSDIIAQPNPFADLTLGIPFFRQNIIQIDFPNKRLRLISRDKLDMKKIANMEMRPEVNSKAQSVVGQQSIKKNDESNRAVKVTVNGKEKWLTLDTTAPAGVTMSREAAIKEKLLDQTYAGDLTALQQNFTSPADLYSLSSLKVGPFELENVLLAVEPEGGKRLIAPVLRQAKTGTLISREVLPDGVLGLEVLQHFVVTVDYTSSMINLSVE